LGILVVILAILWLHVHDQRIVQVQHWVAWAINNNAGQGIRKEYSNQNYVSQIWMVYIITFNSKGEHPFTLSPIPILNPPKKIRGRLHS
jgi:hypothetical protein